MNLENSLFAFGLNYTNPSCGGTPLYNGNISQTFWKTANTDNSLKSYTYQYDALNRIKSGIDNTGRYNLASISYDKNGNILNLDRTGHLDDAGTVFGDMDKLSYRYDTGNKLLAVTDAGNPEQGFKDGNTGTDDYAYDANGNMTLDKNKKITNITYNHLNLPTKISFTFTDDPDKLSEGSIDFVYDAAGIKVSKRVSQKGLQETYDDKNTFYGGNFIYKGAANAKELVFFNHAEGYVEPKEESFTYIYQYKDHLGNIRLAYSDEEGEGIATIKEENNYYPFGLKHKGYNDFVKGREHKFDFLNQERQSDLGLDWITFRHRNSDPALGRFFGVDPITEKYYSISTFQFASNNPVWKIEIEGLEGQTTQGSDVNDKVGIVPAPSGSLTSSGALSISAQSGVGQEWGVIKSNRLEYGESYEGDSNGDGTVGLMAKETHTTDDDFVSGIAVLGGGFKGFTIAKFIAAVSSFIEDLSNLPENSETKKTETTQTDSGGTQKEEKASGQSEQGRSKSKSKYDTKWSQKKGTKGKNKNYGEHENDSLRWRNYGNGDKDTIQNVQNTHIK